MSFATTETPEQAAIRRAGGPVPEPEPEDIGSFATVETREQAQARPALPVARLPERTNTMTTSKAQPNPVFVLDSDGWLLCPACGGNCTHIESATVRDSARNSATLAACGAEDGGGQLQVAIPGRRVGTPGSRRRMDVTLHLWCEFCPGAEITFAQHKGSTEMQIDTPADQREYTERSCTPATPTETSI